MTEHTVAIVDFQGAIKREVKRVRKALQQDETMNSFRVLVEATGRVHDGEVKLLFTVADTDYGGGVTGNDLQACLDELLRRRGWKKVHEPKALSYESVPDGDNMPF